MSAGVILNVCYMQISRIIISHLKQVEICDKMLHQLKLELSLLCHRKYGYTDIKEFSKRDTYLHIIRIICSEFHLDDLKVVGVVLDTKFHHQTNRPPDIISWWYNKCHYPPVFLSPVQWCLLHNVPPDSSHLPTGFCSANIPTVTQSKFYHICSVKCINFPC